MADDPDVRYNALVYLRISLIGLPAMLAGLAGVGYLRGMQDTLRPLIVAMLSAVGNLVLEVVLVYGFDYGIGASALSHGGGSDARFRLVYPLDQDSSESA